MERDFYTYVNICADSLIYLITDHGEITQEAAETYIPAYIHSLLDGNRVGCVILNVNYEVSYIPCPGYDTGWARADGTPISYEDIASYNHWQKYYVEAHAKGIEPFAIAMKAIRKEGARVYFSVRMNDYHYLQIPPACNSLWLEHPEYRVGEKDVFDFVHPEVRHYFEGYIAALCKLYPIDGIEFDMMRGSVYFKPPITEEKSRILSDYLLSLSKAIRAENPDIKVIARLYSDLPSDLSCGFDPAAWIFSGAVDGLVLSNFHNPSDFAIPFGSWEYYMKKSGIDRKTFFLIAGADFAAATMPYNHPKRRAIALDQAMRKGFAAANRTLGADGIYQFNEFMVRRPADLGEMCDSDRSFRGHRRHVLTFRDPGENGTLPVFLAPGESTEIRLATGPKPHAGKVTLIAGCEEPTVLSVSVNGTLLADGSIKDTHTAFEAAAISYTCVQDDDELAPFFILTDIPLSHIQECENVFLLKNNSDKPQYILWVEADIQAE